MTRLDWIRQGIYAAFLILATFLPLPTLAVILVASAGAVFGQMIQWNKVSHWEKPEEYPTDAASSRKKIKLMLIGGLIVLLPGFALCYWSLMNQSQLMLAIGSYWITDISLAMIKNCRTFTRRIQTDNF